MRGRRSKSRLAEPFQRGAKLSGTTIDQPVKKRDVERRHRQLPEVVRTAPTQIACIKRARNARPTPAAEQQQDHAAPACDVGREAEREEVVFRHIDREFLPQLTRQRARRSLSRLDLAAWELPQTAMRLVQRSLLHQHAPTRILQGSCDDEKRRTVGQGHMGERIVKAQLLLLCSMSDARYIRAKLGRYVRLLAQSRRGGTAVEYAMIIAVIFLAVAAAISQTADANLAIWDDVSGKFAEAMQTP